MIPNGFKTLLDRYTYFEKIREEMFFDDDWDMPMRPKLLKEINNACMSILDD